MRFVHRLSILLAVPLLAWSQGGGRNRAAAAQQAAPQPPAAQQTGAAGRGGRGAAGAETTGSTDFYNYNTSAAGGQAIADAPPVETHQKISAGGQALAYTTQAGFLSLHNATTGASEAHVFFTSYTKDGDSGTRPLLFFFGGAPGVAAAWQEFGGLGPKRMNTSGSAPWAENPDTLLPQADLVFVDPVGTGFSRPDNPAHGSSFWNTASDIASMGEFVRSYVNKYNRMTSPLFLAGDDAGTGRVAGLAGYLHDHQIPVRGVVLLSMMTSADSTAGDEQYITLLPSLIMTAWQHKKLAADLNAMSAEQIAGQARQLASREYLHALYKGDRMTPEERTKVIADLAKFTGVSKPFLVSNDLRLSAERFGAELLREQHEGLSNSDTRVTGFVPLPAGGGRGGGGGFGFGAGAAVDYNLAAISPAFLTTYEAYLKRELTFNGNRDGIFYLSSGGVGPYVSTGNDEASLSSAFARNPNLRLFVAVNYYDLNSPFYAAEFTIAHLNVSPEVRAHNITIGHFEAGQMTYMDSKELAKLHRDLAGFLAEGTR